jgi:malonyl-CoA O-methyltransferase
MSALMHTMAQQQSAGSFVSQVAKSFGAASHSYIQGARLQQQVALDALALLPAKQQGHLLDLGCGPGWLHPRLLQHCREFTAVDLSAGMLEKAAQAKLARQYLLADAQQLPLTDASVDTVFSSLMLQWCADPAAVFSEIGRILKPGGKLVLTTLLDGTLSELKQAFAALDNKQHVNGFLPLSRLEHAASAVPCVNWHLEPRRYPLYYPDVQALARELKLLGANQVAGRQTGGLTGKGYWRRLAAAYEPYRTMLGLPASYQVLVISGVKHAGS